MPRGWDELPTGRGRPTPFELYGGDLRGVEQHLDHIESLGANLIYLTPFFPASSTHRYDATSFRHVDPLLGGDAALESLARAAHARGIRLLGDITLNHTGHEHEWFLAARADPSAPERELLLLRRRDSRRLRVVARPPHAAEAQLAERRSCTRASPRSLRRYLELGLDGWRIDVANMVGRYRELDLNRDVSKWTREQVGDALLIAEHGHDFRPDLAVRGWHGVMNYSGFLRPLWTWLLRDDPEPEQQRQFWGIGVGVPQLDGAASVAALRRFRAGVPWESVLHSWNLLDSHDTARFRTIAGSPDRHLVGVGLQMTLPGVPMLFAGDELGLEGAWGEDARRTMPWDRPESWDGASSTDAHARARCGGRCPRSRAAGCASSHVGPDAIAFLRETRDERLLVLAARAPHDADRPSPFTDLETLYGERRARRRAPVARSRIPHLENWVSSHG